MFWMKTGKNGHVFRNKKESPKQKGYESAGVGEAVRPVTECTKTGKTVSIAFYCISAFCSQHRGQAAFLKLQIQARSIPGRQLSSGGLLSLREQLT